MKIVDTIRNGQDHDVFEPDLCEVTDCTIPPVGDLCEAHGGGQPGLVERLEYLINFKDDQSSGDPNWADRELAEGEDANAYSSEIVGSNLHAPVLDLDFPARLVPSSTEGHFHLYLDKPVTWPAYKKLLFALGEAGLLEQGYVGASIDRQATFVRKPGVSK